MLILHPGCVSFLIRVKKWLTLQFVGVVHLKMYQDEISRKDQLYPLVKLSSHIYRPMNPKQEFSKLMTVTTELDHMVLPNSYTKYQAAIKHEVLYTLAQLTINKNKNWLQSYLICADVPLR